MKRSATGENLQRLYVAAAGVLLAVFPASVQPQAAAAPAGAAHPQPAAKTESKTAKLPSAKARREANRLYLAASKLYVNGQFDEALKQYQEAAALDPTDANYRMSAEVARSHDVTALIQTAAKDRAEGDAAGARAALTRAMELDPQNPEVTQHLNELGEDALRGQQHPLYERSANSIGSIEPLLATAGVRSFHVRSNAQQVIQQVFQSYGITALIDQSVRALPVRLDVDDVNFAAATRAVGLVTNTFFVPLDSHRVVVALDTRENRVQFTRQEMETVYLSGLTQTEQNDVANLARNVFNVQQVGVNTNANTLTLHAAPDALNAFNANMRGLLAGHDQVMLDIRIVQLAHARNRSSGVQLPQSMTAFNVYAEEQSILNSNQALVQQIISSGLASPNDPLAIIAILAASGAIPSGLLSGGFALFGGGLTQSALVPGTGTITLNLNTSESRALDNLQMRLGDGEAGTLREGTKYPIQTSTFSNPAGNLPNIPGLTGAGSSSGLSSLIASLGAATPTVPMVQYQDLGLTMKVTPKVLRGDTVALSVDMKIDALSGSFVDGNPILNSQSFTGVVTLKEGEAAELASLINRSESRAISGTPGLSEIPGLNNVTNQVVQSNYATLLIVITPHLVRSTQPAGHTRPMVIGGAMNP